MSVKLFNHKERKAHCASPTNKCFAVFYKVGGACSSPSAWLVKFKRHYNAKRLYLPQFFHRGSCKLPPLCRVADALPSTNLLTARSEISPLLPRSGEMFVAVGAAAHCRCAYSRYPRYRTQNQPHPGGVQQHAKSIACGTPPGCNVIEQSIPWVLQTHGYKHCATPWCGDSIATAPRRFMTRRQVGKTASRELANATAMRRSLSAPVLSTCRLVVLSSFTTAEVYCQ